MDIDQIVNRLRSAHKQYDPIVQKRNKIIAQEANGLKMLYKKLVGFSTTKEINGQTALLIFMYKDSNLDLISDEVYLNEQGKVTYQCFDQRGYKEIVPDAVIRNGYVEVSPEYFLENVPLIKILNFFEERSTRLMERSFEMEELNEKRIKFMQLLQEKTGHR